MRLQSLKSKAALAATAAVLLLFAVFATVEVRKVRADMQAAVGMQMQVMVSRVTEEVDDKLQLTQHALVVTAAAIPPAMATDLAAMERSLRDQPGYRSLFDDVFLVGRDGTVKIDIPDAGRRGIVVSDRDYYKRTMATRAPVISEPYMGRGLKEPSVMMTAPILDAGGEVVAMLTGVIHPLKPNVLGHLREQHVGTSGRFGLVSDKRVIIVSQYEDRIMTTGPAAGVVPVFDHILSGRAGWEEAANQQDLRSVYAYQPLKAAPWIVVAALPVEEAYMPIAALQEHALSMAGFLALLMAPLVWFGMEGLLYPIGTLRDTIRKLRADPAADAQVLLRRNDELGDLANDFNAMIVERRRDGAALRESEERYRRLTQLASDWYWEQDAEFRFTRFLSNLPGEAEVRGTSRSIGKRRWELPSLNISEEQWAAHRALLQAHATFRDFEVCRPGLDGKPVYSAISGEPMYAEDGSFTGYRGVGRDITALRVAEHEAKFRQRMESLMLIISSRFLNAPEGEIDSIIEDTLREVGDFIGADRCYVNLLDDAGEYYSTVNEWCGEGIAPKRPDRQNVPVASAAQVWSRVKNNEAVFVTVSELPEGSPLKALFDQAGIKTTFGVPMLSGGKLIGGLGFDAVRQERRWSDEIVVLIRIAADVLGGIIGQRRAAAAQRASEEKFSKAFRSSPMWVALSTVADAKYIEVNDAQLAGTGHTRDEVVGRTAYDIGLWHDPEDRRRAIGKMQRHGRLSSFVARLCKKSGETLICEIWGEPIEISGTPCVIWITNDISERSRAEAEIRQLNETLDQRVRARTAELEAALNELDAFSYSISHDLRTPLRGIAGFSRLLSDDLKGKLEAKNQRLLDRIIGNATRMGRLIDEVLQYSRLSRAEVRRRDVDLDQLVAEVVAEFADEYPGVSVTVSPLGRADADPTMVRQIFHNLVANAMKYSARAAHPVISIAARRVEADAGTATEYTVRDNGVGFDMQHASHLFELFARLHAETEFEGIGAGLAIVKRLVGRHGGRIHADAEPGKGATFAFTLGGARD